MKWSLLVGFAGIAICAITLRPFQLYSGSQKNQPNTESQEKGFKPAVSEVNRANDSPQADSENVTSKSQPKSIRITELPPNDAWYKTYVIATICLVLIGLFGVLAALKTLKHMRESSETQLRAYVLPDDAGIVDGTVLKPPQPDKANVPGVAMLIRNSGQTPAYKVISLAKLAVVFPSDENTALAVPQLPEQFYNTLGPGRSFSKALWFDRPLTANEVADIAIGKRAIYLYGRIEYRDAFGKPRFTNFRLHYSGEFPPQTGAIFHFSERGNDTN